MLSRCGYFTAYPAAAAEASAPDGPCSPANSAAAMSDQPSRCMDAATQYLIGALKHLRRTSGDVSCLSATRAKYWRGEEGRDSRGPSKRASGRQFQPSTSPFEGHDHLLCYTCSIVQPVCSCVEVIVPSFSNKPLVHRADLGRHLIIMAGRHLLMRRLGTLARQLSASESSRSAAGVTSLVQQVCSEYRSATLAALRCSLLCAEVPMHCYNTVVRHFHN